MYARRIQTIKIVIFELICGQVPLLALVSWDKICLPKAAGRLNIMNLKLWNNAAILKLLWAIDQKKDS
ncbi:hypothetical protein H5410_022568 [Solanum commersonii]|uniref:Uncharacterized protein n=1 Tax=Solanum commersonii TaxID=4109 RepID=A0A9J5ZH53_SOLCO|nr:hypothetical protein H5410_022568 [Solanum commersonii]